MDPKRPELTPYPFKVVFADNLDDIDDVGIALKGYYIMMRADVRDVFGQPKLKNDDGTVLRKKVAPFPFRLKLAPNSHDTVIVTAPLLDWSDRGNDDHIIRSTWASTGKADLVCGIDDATAKFVERCGGPGAAQIAKKHYVLQFANHPHLTVAKMKIHNTKKYKTTGDLTIEGLPLAVDLTHSGEQLEQRTIIGADGKKITVALWKRVCVPRFYWAIADKNMDSKKRGPTDVSSSDEEDGVAAMAAAMKIS